MHFLTWNCVAGVGVRLLAQEYSNTLNINLAVVQICWCTLCRSPELLAASCRKNRDSNHHISSQEQPFDKLGAREVVAAQS